MNYTQELEHRLRMVEDDLQVIKKFIKGNNLDTEFKKPTSEADECWTHLYNIQIACNLKSEEALSWNSFSNH
jgi:hypothetical protein